MKIQLQSLRVINGGPLRDVCIHFNTKGESPVTVLAGANGSGKTTTLNSIMALAKLLDVDTYREPEPFPSLNSIPQVVSATLPPTLTRSENLISNWLIDDKPFALFYGGRPKDAELTGDYCGLEAGKLEARYGEVRGETAQRIHAALSLQNNVPVQELYGDNLELADGSKVGVVPSILYFPHDRALKPVQGQQVQRVETTYQWIYQYNIANEFTGSLDSYLIWLDYAEPEIYAQVIDFLNGLDFEGKKFGVRRKELRAIVTTRDGQTHGVAELSSGEQNILIMLLELRRRLLPYSIVLIDEIENSLHPAFQHRIGQALRKMQETTPFQLILTTHASDFARIFGPESVRILTEF